MAVEERYTENTGSGTSFCEIISSNGPGRKDSRGMAMTGHARPRIPSIVGAPHSDTGPGSSVTRPNLVLGSGSPPTVTVSMLSSPTTVPDP